MVDLGAFFGREWNGTRQPQAVVKQLWKYWKKAGDTQGETLGDYLQANRQLPKRTGLNKKQEEGK